MSLFDDDRPVKKSTHEIGSDVSLLSVSDLQDRIEILKAEIARLEEISKAKAASKSAAQSFFKT